MSRRIEFASDVYSATVSSEHPCVDNLKVVKVLSTAWTSVLMFCGKRILESEISVTKGEIHKISPLHWRSWYSRL
jgi:hypothetical protein